MTTDEDACKDLRKLHQHDVTAPKAALAGPAVQLAAPGVAGERPWAGLSSARQIAAAQAHVGCAAVATHDEHGLCWDDE